jgi:hypothetical protein
MILIFFASVVELVWGGLLFWGGGYRQPNQAKGKLSFVFHQISAITQIQNHPPPPDRRSVP